MIKHSLLLSLLLSVLFTKAQSYDLAAGMRLGTDWGLTIMPRVAKKTTVEVLLQSSLQREEVLFTLLGEQHFPILSRRLNIYYGAGFHKGWINENDVNDVPYKDPFGLTFIGGIELSLGRLNLTYDFKPALNLSGGQEKFYTQTGISLRYVIIKREWRLFGNNKKKNRRKMESVNWKFWERD